MCPKLAHIYGWLNLSPIDWAAETQCRVIGPDLIEQIRFDLSNLQKWYSNNS